MNTDLHAETLLREMRERLSTAHDLEVSGEIEQADGVGATAANKLAIAVFLTCRDLREAA